MGDEAKKVSPLTYSETEREYEKMKQRMLQERYGAVMGGYDSMTGRVKHDTRISIGDQVLKEEDVAEMLDVLKFMRYLLETDPAMKERMVAFRTMQRLLK